MEITGLSCRLENRDMLYAILISRLRCVQFERGGRIAKRKCLNEMTTWRTLPLAGRRPLLMYDGLWSAPMKLWRQILSKQKIVSVRRITMGGIPTGVEKV